MFTVTMGRSFVALSLIALVAASSSAAAQTPVIIRTDGASMGGNVNAVVHRAIQVSDDSIRSYLTRFEPSALDDDSGDATIVTMVLDNDGTYVRSSSRHAKVLQAVTGGVYALNGDSLRAIEAGAGGVIRINRDSLRSVIVSSNTDGPAIAVGGAVGSIVSLRRGDATAAPVGMAGVSPDEIGGIATKRYAAGEMGKGQLIVTLIYLK